MLWVYGRYKYIHSYSAGIDLSRQNLTSVGPPPLRGLTLRSHPIWSGETRSIRKAMDKCIFKKTVDLHFVILKVTSNSPSNK